MIIVLTLATLAGCDDAAPTCPVTDDRARSCERSCSIDLAAGGQACGDAAACVAECAAGTAIDAWCPLGVVDPTPSDESCGATPARAADCKDVCTLRAGDPNLQRCAGADPAACDAECLAGTAAGSWCP
jgi:hypothetical protein